MIKDLKELQALLKLCRKQGVTEITFGDVVCKFGELPLRKSADDEGDSDDTSTDAPTPEEMLFFSAPREVDGMGG